MKEAAPYKKLPGFGRGLASYTRLYLGADHLLQVSSTMFTERYKRFYFRDIQAIIILRTPIWIWFMFALGGCGALMLFIALISQDDAVVVSVFSVLAGLFLALAVAHALRGPSCRCYIRTAVQTERVPSLSRVRRAEKVLASIKATIDAAQVSVGPVAQPDVVVDSARAADSSSAQDSTPLPP